MTVQQSPSDGELRRLVMAHWDLFDAERFLRRLNAYDLAVTDLAWDDDITARALFLAFVISYARPFKRSRGTGGHDALPIAALAEFTAEDRTLHDDVLALRDRAFAHSDADAVELVLDDPRWNGTTTRMSDGRMPFSREQVNRCHRIASRARSWVSERLKAAGKTAHQLGE